MKVNELIDKLKPYEDFDLDIVVHARKVAEDKRADADWNWRHGRLNSDDCIKCAEEYEQFAEWLEELQQYRAIGTVRDFGEAIERRKAKEPIEDGHGHKCCPCCGWIVYKDEYGGRYLSCCENCGQAILWENKNETST